MRLLRAHRILKTKEYRDVLANCRRVRCGEVVVAVVDSDHFQLGMAVSKKVGNAVHRNRLRRRIREIVRKVVVPSTPKKVVIIAQPDCAELGFSELREKIYEGMKMAGVSLL